jgi:hypothetical protein
MLPQNFPSLKLRSTDLQKLEWFHNRYCDQFYEQYGFGHFIMAAYAAVPALLTPDLLYKIWQNFDRYTWNDIPARIHRISVSDILLSPLCREVGYELYEMHDPIRLAFQSWLATENDTDNWKTQGFAQPLQIAAFLEEYHNQPNSGLQRWGRGYQENQLWSIKTYTSPADLQHLLWQKIEKAQKENKDMDVLRLLDLWAKTDQRLDVLFRKENAQAHNDFRQNAAFAAALKHVMQENTEGFVQLLKENPHLKQFLNTAGRGLKIDMPSEAQDVLDNLEPSKIWALLVGVDNHKDEKLKLNGCVNDVHNLAKTLAQYVQNHPNRALENHTFVDADAATARVVATLKNVLEQAQNSDIVFLSFSGHCFQRDMPRREGRIFMFHDTKSEFHAPRPKFKGASKKSDIEVDIFQESFFSQLDLEKLVFPFLQQKRIHVVCFIDSHDADAAYRTTLEAESPIRNAQTTLKGGFLCFNGAAPSQMSKEARNKAGEQMGLFSCAFLETLAEEGTELSYRFLMEKIRLRISYEKWQQTPYLEAFPKNIANCIFLTQEPDAQKVFKVVYDHTQAQWVLEAGAQQGMRPSLAFMPTLLQRRDGSFLMLSEAEVTENHAFLQPFDAPSDLEQTFEVVLVQMALPKMKVFMAQDFNAQLQQELFENIERHKLYYISLVENVLEAKYTIGTRENTYFLGNLPEAEFPIFKYEHQPLEFIKQMENIAQLLALLDLNNRNSHLDAGCLQVEFSKREGTIETGFEVLRPTQTLGLNYALSPQAQWIEPAFTCRISVKNKQTPLYVTVLALDASVFAILNMGQYFFPKQKTLTQPPPITRGIGLPSDDNALFSAPQTVRFQDTETIELFITDEHLARGENVVMFYLKFILSEKPIDVAPILQDELSFSTENTRSATLQRKAPFTLAHTDWTTFTVPIRLAKPSETQQQETEAPESETMMNIGDYVLNDVVQSNMPLPNVVPPRPKLKIYISHSSRDSQHRAAFEAALKTDETTQWQILRGRQNIAANTQEEILDEAIADADFVVCLLSTHYFNSKTLLKTELPKILTARKTRAIPVICVPLTDGYVDISEFRDFPRLPEQGVVSDFNTAEIWQKIVEKLSSFKTPL